MKAALLLLWHSLKRIRSLLLAATLLLLIFQFALILTAASVHKSNTFAQMSAMIPPFARDLIGPSIAGMMSFKGLVCAGYFDVVIIASLVALCISLGTTPTAEIESGFMDLVLSRPVARHWVITRAIALVVLSTLAVLAIMIVGTWVGLTLFAPPKAVWPTPTLIGSLALNLGLLMLFWSALSMAIGCASQRRSFAAAVAGLLAVGTFLLDYVARLWKVVKPFGWLSPFRYFNPFDMLVGVPVPGFHLGVLAAGAVVAFAASYVLFARRDITH